jgi:hypothetical protein
MLQKMAPNDELDEDIKERVTLRNFVFLLLVRLWHCSINYCINANVI